MLGLEGGTAYPYNLDTIAVFSGYLPGLPKWFTRSLEFNFPINTEKFSNLSTLVQESIDNAGVNMTAVGGALQKMAAMLYSDVGYTFMETVDFASMPIEDIQKFLNCYAVVGKFDNEEAYQMFLVLYNLYHTLQQQAINNNESIENNSSDENTYDDSEEKEEVN